MIHNLDTNEFDMLITSLYECQEEAGQLENSYNQLARETDGHKADMDEYEIKHLTQFLGLMKQWRVLKRKKLRNGIETRSSWSKVGINFTDTSIIALDESEKQLEAFRSGFKEAQDIEINLKRLSILIISCERHLIQQKMKYMGVNMQQKHELKKHFIKESYRNKINAKTENLKRMLSSVDEILTNWKEIRDETEAVGGLELCINKEIEQIDIQIELEEQRIQELKEVLEKRKEMSSDGFKAKLDEIERLEQRKVSLIGIIYTTV